MKTQTRAMKHESKTVHVDERQSFSGSLVTIFAEKGARTAEGKTTRETLPGKSRVGRILLNDNHSQNRMLDMRLTDIHQMRRKAETFISHQQKTFITNMEKRQDSWVREHERFSTSTNLALPPGERKTTMSPLAREPTKLSRAQGEQRESRCNESRLTACPDQAVDRCATTLPAITYLTEDSDAKPCGTGFAKQPDICSNRPAHLMVGLPPITNTRKTGFQPSGSVDELCDDTALRRTAGNWPRKRGVENGAGDSLHANFLPTIDPANPNHVPEDNESQLDGADVDKSDDEPEDPSATPLLVLSRTLPRIQLNMPQTRKFRTRKGQRSKIRRKRSRGSDDPPYDAPNPLGDERYTKLRELLSNEVVTDHETRDLDALAEGLMAAKRFGKNWTNS